MLNLVPMFWWDDPGCAECPWYTHLCAYNIISLKQMPTVRITVLTKMYVKWCFIQIAKLLSGRLHNLLTALLNRVGAVSDGPFFFN